MENKRKRNGIYLMSQSGFTLLEMMCVLVILGMVFSITIHRFDVLSETAYQKALHSAIQELNIRETLIWSDFKISTDGWLSDDDVFKRLDTRLGGEYRWDPSAGKLGGSLHFGSSSVELARIPSTSKNAGSWQ